MRTIEHHHKHDGRAVEATERHLTAIPSLSRLFSLDLAQCPAYDRAAEYHLACRTRAAWLRLVNAVRIHAHCQDRLSPSLQWAAADDTVSERDILHLLQGVNTTSERPKTRERASAQTTTETWVEQIQADLAEFRRCRDEMVQRNLRFVVMLARRLQSPEIDFLDLVQEGTLGLMRALEKFDPDRGIRFASYAVWWIREAFAHAFPSRESSFSSIATPAGEESEETIVDRIAAPDDASPEFAVLHANSVQRLHQALTQLSQQEQDIVRLRFGLGEQRPYTLTEVSQRLGLSREQVRLREQRGLVRLRRYLQQTPSTVPQESRAPRRLWQHAA